MFATQQSGGCSNSIAMWFMNRYSSTYVADIDNFGSVAGHYPTTPKAERPTLYLKSTIKILSGSGTQSNPYVVGL